MNMSTLLTETAEKCGLSLEGLQFPDCTLDPASIRLLMVSEVPPKNPEDWFYSVAPDPDYVRSTLGLFRQAGVEVGSMQDILNLGIYITTAVKIKKTGYFVDNDVLAGHLPLLEAEIDAFPNLKGIACMGDVAIKAINKIAKARTKKNVIPSKPTGGIHMNEYFWGDLRVFPSYIITGKNLLIEKFKCDTIAEDIQRMMTYLKG